MSFPSQPRVYLSGAGSGLGRAFALRLAKRNARLFLCDINLPDTEETARLCRNAGASEAIAALCNVGDFEQVRQAAERIRAGWGGVDLVINNAGVAAAGALTELPLSDWHWVMETNFWGVLHGCQAFLPMMKESNAGCIINIASAAGLLNAPRMAPYNCSKAAVVSLSETLRAELEGTGVGVSVACPFFFPTKIIDSTRTKNARDQQVAREYAARSRLSADDVAECCLKAAERGRLHILPTSNVKLLWLWKRLFPVRFLRIFKGR